MTCVCHQLTSFARFVSSSSCSSDQSSIEPMVPMQSVNPLALCTNTSVVYTEAASSKYCKQSLYNYYITSQQLNGKDIKMN